MAVASMTGTPPANAGSVTAKAQTRSAGLKSHDVFLSLGVEKGEPIREGSGCSARMAIISAVASVRPDRTASASSCPRRSSSQTTELPPCLTRN